MKKNWVSIVMLSLFFSSVWISCRKNETQIGETLISVDTLQIELSEIPFADSYTLDNLKNYQEVINWQLVRKLTLIDFEDNFKESMNWQGCSLSEKPVVVFGENSVPRYYEFIVVNQAGKGVGTMTAFAKRETTSPTAFAIPYVRNYSQVLSKGSNYQVFTGRYPTSVVVGIPGKSGNKATGLIDADTGEPIVISQVESYQEMIDFINSLTDERLLLYGIENKGEYLSALEQEAQKNTEYANVFWGVMSEIQDSLLAMPDELIVEKCNEDKSWLTTRQHIIPAYSSTAMQNTRWNGWCGPSELSWIYRGQFSTFDGTYLPLTNESTFITLGSNALYGRKRDFSIWGTTGQYFFLDVSDNDNDGRVNHLDKDWVEQQSNLIDGGLYHNIAENTSIYTWDGFTINTGSTEGFMYINTTLFDGDGPTFPWQLGKALMDVSNNSFDVKFVLSPYAFKNIEDRNLPVLINVEGYSHYVTAFGARREYNNWEIRLTRWFRRTISVPTGNKWFLIHDNGYKTSDYNYKPYWRTSKVSYADLHYNVKRQ